MSSPWTLERKPWQPLKESFHRFPAWGEGCFPTNCATAGWDSANTNLSPRRAPIVPSKRRCDAWLRNMAAEMALLWNILFLRRFQVIARQPNTVVTKTKHSKHVLARCWRHFGISSCPLMLPFPLSSSFQSFPASEAAAGGSGKNGRSRPGYFGPGPPHWSPPWCQLGAGRWWTAHGWQSTTGPWVLMLNMKA